jgi:hypothetical protein
MGHERMSTVVSTLLSTLTSGASTVAAAGIRTNEMRSLTAPNEVFLIITASTFLGEN